MADEAALSPPKKKKLPFKPTALRRAAQSTPKGAPSGDQDKPNDADNDGLDLFRRSKEMAPIVAADQERRLLKKKRQQQQEEEERRQRAEEDEQRRRKAGEKRRLEEEEEEEEADGAGAGDVAFAAWMAGKNGESSTAEQDLAVTGRKESFALDGSQPLTAHSGNFREPVTPPPSKRSRHTSSPSQNLASSPDQAHSVPDSSPPAHVLRSHSKPDGPSRLQEPAAGAQRMPPTRDNNVISLDSDSDDDSGAPAVPVNNRQSSLEIIDRDPSPTAPIPQNNQEDDEDDEFAEYERRAAEQRARDLVETGKEQVDIIVTSDIPGAHTGYFKFLFNKPLRLVRDSWIALQLKKGVHLPPDQRDDMLLTWRRKRVYNVSTLLSIGIRPDGDGRVATEGFSREGLNSDRTRVHMEAWTLDTFQKMEREAELHRRREAGDEMSDDGEGGDAVGGDGHDDAPTPPPEVKLRVILKARDIEDVKLTVRLETTVDTLITGFRTQRNIDPDKDVSLWWDGERLAGHITMAEAEIDDKDTIDVHVKSPVEIDD